MRHALVALAALIASPVWAAEPATADAPHATASPAMSVADQIDAYLKSSPALELADDDAFEPTSRPDRRPHGEVAIGVGTRGYRSVYMRSDLPIGETGWLSIAIEDSRYGGRSDRRRGLGPSADIIRAAPVERQRCDLEIMTPARPSDAIGGPNGRCPR